LKTFICVLVIFALLCAFISINSFIVSKKISEMIEIADSLPKSTIEFEENKKEAEEKTEKLRKLWHENIKKLSYVASYELLDRTDEAMSELFGACAAGDANGFIPAVSKFTDTLERLKILFGVSAQSLA
jgi:hypothetical protein